MNDKKLKTADMVVTKLVAIMSCVTVIFQIVAFEPLLHTALCSCILLVITIALILDGIMQNKKDMILYSIEFLAWFLIIIMTI